MLPPIHHKEGIKMRVLIISDTHGKSDCLTRINDIVGHVDMLIHLGDVEGDEKLVHDLFDCEIHMVRGNCDYNEALPIFEEVTIGEKKAFITHGHKYGVSLGTKYFETLIDENGYDFVMYGHTHRRDLTSYKDSYIVNPGSLALPRDNDVGTYMILDFDQHGTPFFAQNELPKAEPKPVQSEEAEADELFEPYGKKKKKSFWESFWG